MTLSLYEAMTSLQILLSTHQWSPHERHCVYMVSSSIGYPIISVVKNKGDKRATTYVYDEYKSLLN